MAMANNQRDPEREAFWRGVIRRQSSSSLNVCEFCELEQLKENSFYAWRRTMCPFRKAKWSIFRWLALRKIRM